MPTVRFHHAERDAYGGVHHGVRAAATAVANLAGLRGGRLKIVLSPAALTVPRVPACGCRRRGFAGQAASTLLEALKARRKKPPI
jgi:hypothetical protein